MLIRHDERLFHPALTELLLGEIWQAVVRQASLLTHAQQVELTVNTPAQVSGKHSFAIRIAINC